MAVGRGGIRIPIITEFNEKGINKFANQTAAIGRNLTKSLTLPILGVGAAAVKMSIDFETSMAKIVGLVGVGAEEVKMMSKETLNLASQFGKTGTEAAEALFFITSAGLRGADAMNVLRSSLQASAIGLGETKTIADLLTSAVNAYGSSVLSAGEATDILVAAVREGKLEAPELAQNMGRVLPIASALGVSFDQVAAAFAALSRTGTNAAEAATQIRGILATLAKPTKQARDELEKYGLSAQGLREQLREKGLLSVLQTLTTTFDGNDEAIARVFGNIRALSGVMDLMGANAETTKAIFDSLTDSSGSADKAFEAISQTAGFKLNVAISTVKNSLIAFGDILAPIVLRGAELVKGLADRFGELTTEQRKIILVALGILAALGPALLLISALSKAVLILASAFGLLSKSIVLIPLIIFSLIGAFKSQSDAQYILAKETGDTWGMIRRFIINGLTGSSQAIEGFVNAVAQWLGTLYASATFYLNPLNWFRYDPTGAKMREHFKKIQDSIDYVDFSDFREKVENFDAALIGLGKTVSDINTNFNENVAIADEVQKQVEELEKALKDLGQEQEDTGDKAAELKRKAQELKNALVQIRQEAVNKLTESLDEAKGKLNEAQNQFNDFKNTIKGAITGVLDFGKAVEEDSFIKGLTDQAEAAKNFADRVKTLVQLGLSERALTEVLKAGNVAGTKIADEIIAGGQTVVTQVNELVGSVASVAEQVGDLGANEFYLAGVQQGEALVNGILTALKAAQADLVAAQRAAATGGAIANVGGTLQQALRQEAITKGNQKALDLINKVTQGGAGKVSSEELKRIQAAGVGKGLVHPSKRLAKGGIVLGPTNALIGEAGPEAIVPLSGANSARGGMGATYNITVNAGVGTDGAAVGRQIVEAIKKFERSSGQVFARA